MPRKTGPELTSVPIFLYFICGMPTTAWLAKRCHVCTWDLNRRTPRSTEAEHVHLPAVPPGRPLLLKIFKPMTKLKELSSELLLDLPIVNILLYLFSFSLSKITFLLLLSHWKVNCKTLVFFFWLRKICPELTSVANLLLFFFYVSHSMATNRRVVWVHAQEPNPGRLSEACQT